MSEQSWTLTHSTLLACYDGNDQIPAPPEHVLDVCVVADRVFLDLCEFDETHDTTTTKQIAHIHVDASALLNALVAQMGIERVQLALPWRAVQ